MLASVYATAGFNTPFISDELSENNDTTSKGEQTTLVLNSSTVGSIGLDL